MATLVSTQLELKQNYGTLCTCGKGPSVWVNHIFAIAIAIANAIANFFIYSLYIFFKLLFVWQLLVVQLVSD